MNKNDPPFESLVAALEGWFDRSFAELSGPLRDRVESDFNMPWDDLTPEQRRHVAEQWDYQHDPAFEAERQRGFDLGVEKDDLRREIDDLELMAATTPLEHESKKRQLRELRTRLAQLEARGNPYPAHVDPIGQERSPSLPSMGSIPIPGGEDDRVEMTGVWTSKPVTSHVIKAVFPGPSDNGDDWWNIRMGDAKRYKLAHCRACKGRGSNPSLWYPDCVAIWLADKGHLAARAAASKLRTRFPECAEAADTLELSAD